MYMGAPQGPTLYEGPGEATAQRVIRDASMNGDNEAMGMVLGFDNSDQAAAMIGYTLTQTGNFISGIPKVAHLQRETEKQTSGVNWYVVGGIAALAILGPMWIRAFR